MDKNSTVLSIALKHDMEVFATLKPRSKYVSIAKNIIEYQKSSHKCAVAKNEQTKDEHMFNSNRFFASARRKVQTLTPEQLEGFENYLVDRFGSVTEDKALESMQVIKTAITLLEDVGKNNSQLYEIYKALENEWVM